MKQRVKHACLLFLCTFDNDFSVAIKEMIRYNIAYILVQCTEHTPLRVHFYPSKLLETLNDGRGQVSRWKPIGVAFVVNSSMD